MEAKKLMDYGNCSDIELQDGTIVSVTHTHKSSASSGKNRFEAICARPITQEDLQNIQLAMNYHPAGYGFHIEGEMNSQRGTATYVNNWFCWGDCD